MSIWHSIDAPEPVTTDGISVDIATTRNHPDRGGAIRICSVETADQLVRHGGEACVGLDLDLRNARILRSSLDRAIEILAGQNPSRGEGWATEVT